MFKEDEIDSGKFILPGESKIPDWVLEKMNTFRSGVYDIAGKYDSNTKGAIEEALVLLKQVLPKGIKLDYALGKKGLGRLTNELDAILNDYEFPWYIWMLSNCGFILSTVFPTSLDEVSLQLPASLVDRRREVTEKFKNGGDQFVYIQEIDQIAADAIKWFTEQENAIGDFIGSGANGSVTHIQELLVGIGFALNSKGQIVDTITNSLMDGVDQTDYFSNSSQAIQALYAKSAETAKPGYLGKKLSNICERVKLASIKDCGTDQLAKIRTGNKDFLKSFIGKMWSTNPNGSKLKMFTPGDIPKVLNKTIYFRMELYCRAKGNTYCNTCYNPLFIAKWKLKPGDNIGLYASTGITGSLVNLTLKKSHIGVSVDRQEVDLREDLKNM